MTTGIDTLDSSLQETNLIINGLAEELGWTDRKKQAYSLMRTVLHAFRDRLSVDEAANFGAQLPLVVRGVYYDGWKPESAPQKMNRQELIDRVDQQFQYDTELPTEDLIEAAMRHVALRLDPLMMDNLAKNLPEDVATLLP